MRQIRLLVILSLAILALVLPARSFAQVSVGVGISVHVGPPALPVYAQPVCPGAGYIWTPGYWAWGAAGYYWVPGTWVVAPVGLLWTPGYWGWGGGAYLWHAGYWGPHVGFYGGINYGFGYGGAGFVGGAWNHGVFAYNTAVTNVNTTVIHNTYNKTVVVNNTTVNNNVSYNGGTGGTTAAPTAAERAAEKEPHTAATNEQTEHEHAASTNKALLASENHGKPSIAATSKPGQFKGPGVVGAGSATSRDAAFHPANSNKQTESAGDKNKTVASNTSHGNSSGGSNQKPKHNDSKPLPKNKNNNPEHHEGKEHPH